MSDEPLLPVREIWQVSIVTDDLQRTIERYWSVFGIGPWSVYTFGPDQVKDVTYRGRPATLRTREAMAVVGGLVYAVVQPLEGESILHEFLAKHGPGFQHVAVRVRNLDEALARLRPAGYDVLGSGRLAGAEGDGAFAWLGSQDDLATVFELVQLPRSIGSPEATYP